MKNNTRFVIAQFPNRWLWIMIATWPLSYVLSGHMAVLARTFFYVAAVVWAYEEMVRGVNWFRNLLGAAVLIMVMISLANQLGL